MQSSKVHLLSTDHFTGVSNTWQMPFDPSLKEVTVALSGPAPDIEIKNPQGRMNVNHMSTCFLKSFVFDVFFALFIEFTKMCINYVFIHLK